MSNIITFTSETFGEIRTVEIDSKTWFVLSDICNALELTNPTAIAKRLENNEVRKVDPKSELGSKSNVKINVINEKGLYRVIFRSDKKEAKEFQNWVFGEVLPQIRKTGGYIPISSDTTADDIQTNATMIANNTIKLITDELSLLQAKADYFDQLVDANLLTNFRDTAKELGLMESYFISLLEIQGYIYRDKAKNIRPTSLSMKQGLMQVKEYFKNRSDYGLQAFITPRGRETFRLLFQSLTTNSDNG